MPASRQASAARFGRNMPSLDCSDCRSTKQHGGIGGGAVETMIVMENFGRVLALEPYLASVILGGGLGAARRRRRHAIGDAAEDRIRRDAPGLRACRAASALRSRRHRNDRAQGWIACHSRWREDPCSERRQRRPIDRIGAAVRDRAATVGHRALSGRRSGEGRHPARLSDDRRPARGRNLILRRARSGRRRYRRARQRLCLDRARDGSRDRRALRRSRRRDGRLA